MNLLAVRRITKMVPDIRKAKAKVEVTNMKAKEVGGSTTRKEEQQMKIRQSERAMSWLREGGIRFYGGVGVFYFGRFSCPIQMLNANPHCPCALFQQHSTDNVQTTAVMIITPHMIGFLSPPLEKVSIVCTTIPLSKFCLTNLLFLCEKLVVKQ